MENAAASVDSRTAAIVCADILRTARETERRLSLRPAELAVLSTPLQRVGASSTRKLNPSAKEKNTHFRNLKEELPRSEGESRKTYRSRLVMRLRVNMSVSNVKVKGEGPRVGIPSSPFR
jgi:hypothetical protein